MRGELETRYRLNLDRVRGLVESYRELGGPGSGRRAVATADVLRSAVVFLHATLEDVLRTLLARRWREAKSADEFVKIGLLLAPGAKPQEKVTLPELLQCRHESVDELLQRSIDAHLELSSFNHLGEVKMALRRSGFDDEIVAPMETALASMMARRHQIVHRADRLEVGGSGNHAAASLGTGEVEAWIAAIEHVTTKILAQL